MDLHALELSTKKTGEEIFKKIKRDEPRFWEPVWWERQTIQWLVSDPETKSRVLRFIDVFPSLRTDRAIARHIREYLPHEAVRMPGRLRLGRALAGSALLTPGAAAAATRLAVKRIARQFIAGATLEETAQTLDAILENGMKYTLDLLGEATLSESEADAYAGKYEKLIRFLAAGRAPGDPEVNVSLKLSSLTPRFDPIAPDDAAAEALSRLRPILRAARETGARVNIDMEHYELRDLTLDVFMKLLRDREYESWDGLGIVAQSYLVDAEESLNRLLDEIRKIGRRVTIRLVKGAYWDREVVTAKSRRWPVPVYTAKADTDAAYERMTVTLLQNADIATAAIASHNIRSIAKAIAAAKELGVAPDRFEIQMLFGMADNVKKTLADMGVPVRVYAPFGEMIPGMAYLVRRLLENSSNESFLRRSFVEDKPLDELLRNPEELSGRKEPTKHEDKESAERIFVNEPDAAFHRKETRDAYARALELVAGKTGKRCPCVIGGERISSGASISSTDPSAPSRVVGLVSRADAKLADSAMNSAHAAFGRWSRMKAEKRFEILSTAADIIRERRFELAAWQTIEVGKTRREAVADVDEAIDHIMYYSIGALGLAKRRPTEKTLGEVNDTFYTPRGLGAVIAPWNFPLAILAGMTCASLAAGNTVVVKPSSSSAVIASLFADILAEAGVPDGVVNFLPGPGEILGPALIGHPKTAFVAFTGSWDVGASIVEMASAKNPNRRGFVKVVAEMGGKNAVIIDESADLDEAVAGVLRSAFGYGGQKCSACSRVIVLNAVYNHFAERLVDAANSLVVGPPSDPETYYGPLIDEAAKKKAESYIKAGMKDATPLLVRDDVPSEGHYVAPAIFGDVTPDHKLAREEIFGPVLSVIRAKDIDHAIAIANDSDYALTGGLYSRTPSSVTKVAENMEAGNLYINRSITGAIVRRQPFGGYKKSGLGGAKAGSWELLRELSVPRAISENIVRHGFSPDLES